MRGRASADELHASYQGEIDYIGIQRQYGVNAVLGRWTEILGEGGWLPNAHFRRSTSFFQL